MNSGCEFNSCLTQSHSLKSLRQRCMFKQGTKSIFTIIWKDAWAQPGNQGNTWCITINEIQGSQTFQKINCLWGTEWQRKLNQHYKYPDLGSAFPAFHAVVSATKLVCHNNLFICLFIKGTVSLWFMKTPSTHIPPVCLLETDFKPPVLKPLPFSASSGEI